MVTLSARRPLRPVIRVASVEQREQPEQMILVRARLKNLLELAALYVNVAARSSGISSPRRRRLVLVQSCAQERHQVIIHRSIMPGEAEP